MQLTGGYTQRAYTSRVVLIYRGDAVIEAERNVRPLPGEELMVLPKADTIEDSPGIPRTTYWSLS